MLRSSLDVRSWGEEQTKLGRGLRSVDDPFDLARLGLFVNHFSARLLLLFKLRIRGGPPEKELNLKGGQPDIDYKPAIVERADGRESRKSFGSSIGATRSSLFCG
jgi:hypothetical protein